MNPASFSVAVFPGAFVALPAPLGALLHSTLQNSESVLLQVVTNNDEALIVTTARLIVLKGTSKTTDHKSIGRYFPLDSISSVATSRGLFGGNIVIITPATAQESIPFDRARCSFAVTFKDKSLLQAVASYLQQVLATVLQFRIRNVASGPLQAISVPGIVAQRGERFYLSIAATLFAEHTYKDYQGGTQGVSVRVLPGLYYRIGGMRGTSSNRSVLEPDDEGLMTLSNQRLIFTGKLRTLDVSYQKIAGSIPFSNGFQVNLSSGKVISLETGEGLSGFLLQRLCVNPPP